MTRLAATLSAIAGVVGIYAGCLGLILIADRVLTGLYQTGWLS